MNRTLTFSTLLLVLAAACGPTGGAPTLDPAPTSASAPSVAAQTLDVALADFAITPAELTATSGTVAFAVENQGPTPHNLTIAGPADAVLAATADLRRMESETVSTDLGAGEYIYFCSLPGHKSLGMMGTLTVTAP